MIAINLIPQYYLDQEKKRKILNLCTVITASLLTLFFAFGGLLLIQLKSVEKNRQALEVEIARYQEVAKQIEALKSKKSQIEAKIAVVEKLLAERFNYPKILEFLTESLLSQIWFTSLNTQNAGNALQVQIQASSLSLNSVIDWLAKLESQSKVTTINLGTITNSSSETQVVSNFQISFQYQP